MPKFCLSFVCQAGELELKSLLLAASLREHLGNEVELVAAIPIPDSIWGSPQDSTLNLLTDIGVRLSYIHNPIGKSYPIGNKIAALGVRTSAEATIFLDSDILCLRPFDLDNAFLLPFSAKPADLATYGKNKEEWEKIYRLFELSAPDNSVLTTLSEEIIAPYFNAGVICVENASKFSQIWAQTCKDIDACPEIENKRPWLDQIGLPVAVKKRNYHFQCLTEKFNYPAHLKPIDPENIPALCHYHWPSIIAREPILVNTIRSLIKKYPKISNSINQLENWRKYEYIFDNSFKTDGSQAYFRHSSHEFIITGIPRSGTSLLCNLLHKQENCVVINEPSEIFKILKTQSIPWSLSCYYKNLRRNILLGNDIENKIKDGEIIQDTKQVDERQSYRPEVTSDSFLLGTKNTLAYISRLDHIRRAMPCVKIIACIRNPYQTIASWKLSFEHLKNAKIGQFPVGSDKDPLIEPYYKTHLDQIVNCNNLSEKRAYLWRHLARLIWDRRNQLYVLKYEDLITDTNTQLQEIFNYISSGKREINEESEYNMMISDRTDILSEADRLAIQNICWPVASLFGYEERQTFQ